jgi:hypothetical protein
MHVTFPIHTSVFIIAFMVATGAGAWLLLSRGLDRGGVPHGSARRWRWAFAIGLITWLASRLLLSVNPPGSDVLATPYSFISFAYLVAGLTVGLVLLAASSRFRQVIRGVPTRGLIGLHAVRIGGFVWLALLDMRLLPATFALSAGYGDVAVGTLALIVVYLLTTSHPKARAVVIGWNVLGLVDFVLAITTAFASMGPFVDEMARSGASLSYLNYPFLIPSFGVPVFGLLHIYSLFQVWSAGRPVSQDPGQGRNDQARAATF